MKRQVPLAISFVCGVLMMVTYYVPRVEQWGEVMYQFFNIITVFAYVLGAGSLIVVNGRKIQRMAPGWGFNLVLILSLVATLYLGIGTGGWYPGHRPDAEHTVFDWIFKYVFTPLSATMFSLLAFFIASASFRAFKAKSLEATLLLATAFVVMLFRVPLGELLWNALPFFGQYDIGKIVEEWIMGCFNAAGQRAILLGASIGLISVSLKILLGVERAYLGSAD